MAQTVKSTAGLLPGIKRPAVQRRGSHPLYRLMTLLTWVLCGGLIWYFLRETRGTSVPAATELGRWYGLAGTGLFFFLATYGLRRIVYRFRLGSMEFWYRAHLLLGLTALVVLGCHSGFAIRSLFLGALQVGMWGTVLTGLVGWAFQSAFKAWMVRNEARPAVLKELDIRKRELDQQLNKLAETAPANVTGLTRVILLEAIGRAKRELMFRRLFAAHRFRNWASWERDVDRAASTPHLKALPSAAAPLLRELNRVEVLRGYHRFLRAWTIVHLAFTGLGVQLMLWHIWMVAVYPR